MTVDLDDILALAASHKPTAFERASASRNTRWVQQQYARAKADGRDLVGDVDLHDPLRGDTGEVPRITRAAQVAKQGTVRWDAATGEMAWSDEMSLIFGWPPGVVRPCVETLYRLIHPDDARRVRRAAASAWRELSASELTCRVIRPGGITRWVHCYIEILTGADGTPQGIIGTAQDVTELELARRERERRARRRAIVERESGNLTPGNGLRTRGGFTDEIDRARRTGSGVLLVVATEPQGGIEPERLSEVIANFVMTLARRTDICGLLGPGQLGVLMPDTGLRPATSLAETMVEKLRDQLFVAGPHGARVDAWGGLVRFEAHDESSSIDLLIDAESAWRHAKETGAVLKAFPRPAPADERQETWRTRVRAAVAGNGFTLYTQPILDLRLNQITRQEILLRPLNDAGNPVPPSALLDIAERVDETLPIDLWVMDNAFELIAQGPPTPHYQINVSGRSLGEPGLLGRVHDLLDKHDVDPRRITFEITETARIDNRSGALHFARAIRELGCQLALDDFGTAYSSLIYLKAFPIDLVKIDGTFISDIVNSPTDQALVRSIVEACQAHGVLTAAEYVKDDATIELLRGFGVDFAQGYRVGPPMPIAGAPASSGTSIELDLRMDPTA
ncbi:sensor domain-containing phosphodiesterase [Phytohabitans kaempferiae]|uniref:EAL domain-containing protein n=1 Tax=Phytohabitans kaempferiae TaxID=1620943 RepID=A0ABV6M7Z3_9ACTN